MTDRYPTEIHTILDQSGRLIASTHEAWVYIAPEARVMIDKALKERQMAKTKTVAKKKTALKAQKQGTKATTRKAVMKRTKK